MHLFTEWCQLTQKRFYSPHFLIFYCMSAIRLFVKRRRSCLICAMTEVMKGNQLLLWLFVFAYMRPYEFTRTMSEYALCATSEEVRVKALVSCKQNALYEQNVLSSHGLHRSTFGDERLNYRVRNGIGWSLSLWFRSYKAFLYEPDM